MRGELIASNSSAQLAAGERGAVHTGWIECRCSAASHPARRLTVRCASVPCARSSDSALALHCSQLDCCLDEHMAAPAERIGVGAGGSRPAAADDATRLRLRLRLFVTRHCDHTVNGTTLRSSDLPSNRTESDHRTAARGHKRRFGFVIGVGADRRSNSMDAINRLSLGCIHRSASACSSSLA